MPLIDSKNTRFLPYGRQDITAEDISVVSDVLRSDWLTQGPQIDRFEAGLASAVGASHAVACANGTAALHLAMLALKIGEGDEVVTSPNTFLASANCARFVGAEVRFADVDASTGLMDPESLEAVLAADIDHKIKAIIPVHFAGQPVDLVRIHELAEKHGARIVDDACHAIGARYTSSDTEFRVGSSPHSDMTVFSFHPVKHVAAGEGGAVTTNDGTLAARLRRFRCHGMQKDGFVNMDMALCSDGQTNPWYYEMQEIGYNYRLTDIQAALAASQLTRLPQSLSQRNQIAREYRSLLSAYFPQRSVVSLDVRPDIFHAYHLFVVQIDFDCFDVSRAELMNRLRQSGIGTQVHYIPVPAQPYYQNRYAHKPGYFAQTERYYERALSLPMFPGLDRADCERVVETLHIILTGARVTA
ncbi:MAG: UDP-4-amino-4,6-dideoxy-N-acetyl-beta-L-altrosamine transaminase [Candidatus Zixiibacteriota bacterium]